MNIMLPFWADNLYIIVETMDILMKELPKKNETYWYIHDPEYDHPIIVNKNYIEDIKQGNSRNELFVMMTTGHVFRHVKK